MILAEWQGISADAGGT